MQLPVLRALTPAARVALACELSQALLSLSADGIRHRQPGLSAEQVADAVRRLLLGADLAERMEVGRTPQR